MDLTGERSEVTLFKEKADGLALFPNAAGSLDLVRYVDCRGF